MRVRWGPGPGEIEGEPVGEREMPAGRVPCVVRECACTRANGSPSHSARAGPGLVVPVGCVLWAGSGQLELDWPGQAR